MTDRRLIRRLLGYVWPHRRVLALVFLLVATVTALEVGLPYLLKVAIDGHIAVRKSDGLLLVAVLYTAGLIGRGLMQIALSYSLVLLGQRTVHDVRTQLHAHVLSRSTSFYDRTPVGRLLTGITADVDALTTLFAGGVVTALFDVLVLVAIVGMMLFLSVELTLVTLAVSLVLVPLFRWAREATRSRSRAVRTHVSELASYVLERLSGAATVQTLGQETAATRAHSARSAAYRDSQFALAKASLTPQPVTEGIAVVAAAMLLLYCGARIDSGLTIGVVVAFVEYSNRVFGPLYSLAQKFGVMQSAFASAERIFALLDTADADAPARVRPADAKTGDAAAAIEFRDIEFGYNGTDRVLHGVSLNVPRGSTVAIVGATGSGKSTLVRLLARHYQPQAGEIFFDGRDVRDVPVAELRTRLTLIAQDVFLFSGTIADNVRLGRQDATDQEIEAALRRVGLLERKPPDTKLVERGANLSHGERQLVAFARALVRDPEVLLLDEATAHVDPETEQMIERALGEMFAGRTCLIIAHRLATIRRADQIIVMDKGRVVEAGTREELLARGGRYAQLEATGSLAVADSAR